MAGTLAETADTGAKPVVADHPTPVGSRAWRSPQGPPSSPPRRTGRASRQHCPALRPRGPRGGGEPTVLLLHAGVTDQRSWAHVVDALPGHRCLTFDARGY